MKMKVLSFLLIIVTILSLAGCKNSAQKEMENYILANDWDSVRAKLHEYNEDDKDIVIDLYNVGCISQTVDVNSPDIDSTISMMKESMKRLDSRSDMNPAYKKKAGELKKDYNRMLEAKNDLDEKKKKAEDEKKKKAEEERRKQQEKNSNTSGLTFSNCSFEILRPDYIRVDFVITNNTDYKKNIYMSDFILKKQGLNAIKPTHPNGGFSKTIQNPMFTYDEYDLYPGDKIRASIDYWIDEKLNDSAAGYALYYDRAGLSLVTKLK